MVEQVTPQRGNIVTERDTTSAVAELRRTLLTTPSWAEAATTIRTGSVHLFTEQEQRAFADRERKSTERRTAAEAAIAAGSSPWRAHVEQNEQDTDRPYLVGFYQIDDKIRPLYAERFYQTNSGINQVNLIQAEVQSVPEPTVLKGRGWDALPKNLQEQFEQGNIFVTSDTNLYELDTETLEDLSASADPDVLINHVQKTHAEADDGYYLLHSSWTADPTSGRGAVLTEKRDGQIVPVIATVNGKEYIVELKGCGRSTGGFPDVNGDEDTYRGHATAEQAQNEFERLEETNDGEPLSAGSVIYEDMGYIIRLSPSTVRASFSNPDVYPNVLQDTYRSNVISLYAEGLAQQIGADHPFLLDGSSHTENLLVWDDQFCWTDYSDQKSFGDGAYPEFERNRFISPFTVLRTYIRRAADIPGYDAAKDVPLFKHALETAFVDRGKEIHVDPTDENQDIARKIWE